VFVDSLSACSRCEGCCPLHKHMGMTVSACEEEQLEQQISSPIVRRTRVSEAEKERGKRFARSNSLRLKC
jgi:hypothetical protein